MTVKGSDKRRERDRGKGKKEGRNEEESRKLKVIRRHGEDNDNKVRKRKVKGRRGKVMGEKWGGSDLNESEEIKHSKINGLIMKGRAKNRITEWNMMGGEGEVNDRR